MKYVYTMMHGLKNIQTLIAVHFDIVVQSESEFLKQ